MTAAALAAVASVAPGEQEDAVVVRSLQFAFPFSQASVIENVDLLLPRGSRCLLTGANGAGELWQEAVAAGASRPLQAAAARAQRFLSWTAKAAFRHVVF